MLGVVVGPIRSLKPYQDTTQGRVGAAPARGGAQQ